MLRCRGRSWGLLSVSHRETQTQVVLYQCSLQRAAQTHAPDGEVQKFHWGKTVQKEWKYLVCVNVHSCIIYNSLKLGIMQMAGERINPLNRSRHSVQSGWATLVRGATRIDFKVCLQSPSSKALLCAWFSVCSVSRKGTLQWWRAGCWPPGEVRGVSSPQENTPHLMGF